MLVGHLESLYESSVVCLTDFYVVVLNDLSEKLDCLSDSASIEIKTNMILHNQISVSQCVIGIILGAIKSDFTSRLDISSFELKSKIL